MKVIVISSNKYNSLIRWFAELFNKHWPNKQDVTVLCFEKPDCNLPSNFEVFSMGNQDSFGDIWSTPIKPYVDSISDLCIVHFFVDHFITNLVDSRLLKRAEDLIVSGKSDKVWLGCWHDEVRKRIDLGKEYDNDFIQWVDYKGIAGYMMSTWLDPSMWNTILFRRMLSVEDSIHKIEKTAKNVLFKEKPIVHYAKSSVMVAYVDAVRRGRFNYEFLENWKNNHGDKSGTLDVGLRTPHFGGLIEKEVYEVFLKARRDFEKGE